MRKITDEKEVRELLAKYEFKMFNRMNNQKGELTTLNQKDIDDIVGDMRLISPLSPVMEVYDNGMVVVKYPDNVCKLESRGLIEGK